MTELMDAKAKVVATLRLTEFVSYHWETSVPVYEMPIGPYIPLTDHEAALAEQAKSANDTENALADAAREIYGYQEQIATLLTGLEALAGECQRGAISNGDCRMNPHAAGAEKAFRWCLNELRTLTNSAKGSGKISVTPCRCVEGSRDQELCMDKRTCSRITPHPANSENHEVLK